MKKWLIGILITIVILAGLGFIFREDIKRQFFKPTQSDITTEVASSTPDLIAQNLATPWSITFLPDGDMLVTEREGQLQRIGENGSKFTIDGVRETSEGGLLGIALSPDFSENNELFLYYTTNRTGSLTNQVDRYKLKGTSLSERTEIITNIPAASSHNGGGIAIGSDDKLYITTGDAAKPDLAQDTGSLAGKILRLNLDGSTPADNPFNNAIWSYGHRNPQGIAWDDSGQLWSVEHGRSGVQSGQDELNRITKGLNYGWPVISGDETQNEMQSPVVHSGDSETWAPGGMAYLDGHLYFAGLRGQSVYKVDISNPDDVQLSRLFASEYGRLRAVTAHDGTIYFSTSNRDGRGGPNDQDDQIFKFKP